MSVIFIILSVTLATVECNNWTDSRVVQTDQGLVRGFKFIGEDVISFYNIPYASVQYRFQVNGPPPTWNETFDAYNRGIICPQQEAIFLNVTGYIMQEDCLVMNIFLPDTNERNLPVLVDLHGGAFYAGHGDAHRYTQFAASKNVVVVTFNHRVGLFGFLCLGTKNVPGNAGMKDIIVGLRWVQRNIANFGGNPDDVTLSGCSAGGAAMDLLLLSKAAEGLFKRAMPDSGVILSIFAVAQDPIEQAKHIARLLNFHDLHNIEALEEFLTVTPFERIIALETPNRPNNLFDYGPCVERDVGQELIFLDDAPYNILKSGNYTKYPLIYSFTDMEGMTSLMNFGQLIEGMNENFGNYLPGDLSFDNETQKREVGEHVKLFYFGNETINENNFMQFIDYNSDTLFAYSILRTVKMHVEAGHTQVYLYQYTYYEEGDILEGAMHCAQASAVRDEDYDTLTDEYRNVKSFLREIWYNFMRTDSPVASGSPVPSWPPVTQTNRSPHLAVGRDIALLGALQEERANFWDAIYEQYYRTPIPPTLPGASTDGATSTAISYILAISLTVIVYLF